MSAMSTFTIDSANNIAVFASHEEATAAKIDNAEYFGSARELNKLAGSWPANRLSEVWNSFAGVAPFGNLQPVKRFNDRKTAVARIWEAIQRLVPNVAQLAPDVAPAKGKRDQDAKKGKQRDTKRPSAKKTANVAREGSKKAEVVDLMRRPKGATLAEVMKATGWQPHTVRGFVSGTLIKKLGLKVESFRSDEKERCYRITG
jgi:Protein of unknown function (DUF3489)